MLLFMDGCDHQDLNDGYLDLYKWNLFTGANNYSATGGRFGTGAIILDNYDYIGVNIGTQSTVILQFWTKSTTGGPDSANWRGVSFRSGGSSVFSVTANMAGTIFIRRGDTSDTIIAQSSDSAFVWTGCYIEIKVTLHDTAGVAIVKVDGVTVINETGIDTTKLDPSCDNIYFNGNAAQDMYLDDVIIMNASGSYNNDFIGDTTIKTIFPTAAGNSADFTPSAGNNYECVDNPTATTADYVSGAAENDKDTYTFGDISTDDSILAVQAHMLAKKDSSGTRKIRAVTRQSSVDYGGDDIALSDTYKYLTQTWEVNPADSAAWVPADVNGAEFGFEVRGI